MSKILIITGQTATGKTSFAVEVAKKFNGELISADSRQVYQGMDIITGKDKDKIDVPIWLYDIVSPDQSFSVSQWREKALDAIMDISSRGKMPIVVGGTGLYLRSLTEDLDSISIPPDQNLRSQNLSLLELQQLLDPKLLAEMNVSDRQNPRRLIRAIEISSSNKVCPLKNNNLNLNIEYIVLTCPQNLLKSRITERVHQRIKTGAHTEYPELTSLYSVDPDIWIKNEYQYTRKQLVFFNKYFPKHHLDVSLPQWDLQALDIINSWTNIS